MSGTPARGMDDDRLRAALRAIGMAAFVRHLDLFKGPQGHAEAAAELQGRSGWTAHSCRSRVSKARAILASGREGDALAMIAASERVEADTSRAARAILRREG
ncbi:hypothetical protein [Pseudogemmobacter sonorensis]|uniref:hypothetical protein n=1 Tax=Pseudogemmobacter sonorensis TaxID=2989681 RepID=UPI0036AE22F3